MKLENLLIDRKHYLLTGKGHVFTGAQLQYLGDLSRGDAMAKIGFVMLLGQLEETELPATNPNSVDGLRHESLIERIGKKLGIR